MFDHYRASAFDACDCNQHLQREHQTYLDSEVESSLSQRGVIHLRVTCRLSSWQTTAHGGGQEKQRNKTTGDVDLRSIAVVVEATKECRSDVFPYILLQEIRSTRMLGKEIANVVDVPCDADRRPGLCFRFLGQGNDQKGYERFEITRSLLGRAPANPSRLSHMAKGSLLVRYFASRLC